jgi:hypothetical protein
MKMGGPGCLFNTCSTNSMELVLKIPQNNSCHESPNYSYSVRVHPLIVSHCNQCALLCFFVFSVIACSSQGLPCAINTSRCQNAVLSQDFQVQAYFFVLRGPSCPAHQLLALSRLLSPLPLFFVYFFTKLTLLFKPYRFHSTVGVDALDPVHTFIHFKHSLQRFT